ncbi:hypothetical protein KKH05_01170 [Patescibacteria group bacterium]|nr:hypothetical protein [Patescibacteria group bacterium]
MDFKPEKVVVSQSSELISEEEKQRRLEEIEKAQCVWREKATEDGVVEVSLPYDCRLIGQIDEASKAAEIRSTFAKNVSAHGVATRLMRAFVSEAKSRGVEKLTVKEIITSGGLQLSIKVFGIDSVHFFARPYGSPVSENREISVEEAEQLVAEKAEPTFVPNEQEIIDVGVDLRELDTEGWESPISNNEISSKGVIEQEGLEIKDQIVDIVSLEDRDVFRDSVEEFISRRITELTRQSEPTTINAIKEDVKGFIHPESRLEAKVGRRGYRIDD